MPLQTPLTLTLNQVLAIVGRLDDAPGFDTPRERFRRFLTERMTDVASASLVIDQCQQMLGEQHQRALQDAVVVLGRFLGFETAFGSYAPSGQGRPTESDTAGEWRSRRRLTVCLKILSDQAGGDDVEALSAAVSSVRSGDEPRVGLCLVTPRFARRGRLEDVLGPGRTDRIRLLSLRSALQLADMVTAGTLTHDDVVRILSPRITLDWMVDLLQRLADGPHSDARRALPGNDDAAAPHGGSECWVAIVGDASSSPPEQFVATVSGVRESFGAHVTYGAERGVQAGDSICFFVSGRGVIAEGEVADSTGEAASPIRDAKRAGHTTIRVRNVEVYDVPVVPATDLRLKLDLQAVGAAAPVVVPISKDEYHAVTTLHAQMEQAARERSRFGTGY